MTRPFQAASVQNAERPERMTEAWSQTQVRRRNQLDKTRISSPEFQPPGPAAAALDESFASSSTASRAMTTPFLRRYAHPL